MELTRQLQGLDSLKTFWHWWRAELLAMTPAWLLEFFAPTAPRLQVVVQEQGARLQLLSAGETRVLTECDLLHCSDEQLQQLRQQYLQALPEGVVVELYLPAGAVLRNTVTLPLAIEANLDSVLHFEIDRLTPFKPDQGSLGYRLLQRHPEQEKLSVEILVVSQQRLERLLARLAFLRLHASAVYPQQQDDTPWPPSANLLHHDRRPAVETLFNARARQLSIVLALLLVAVLGYPAWQLHRQAATLNQEIAQIQAEAGAVGDKRADLLNRLQLREGLLQRRDAEAGTLALLLEITRLLPDDTWVSDLEIDQRGIVLQGESGNAFDLIELLEQSGQFHNAAFGSPVTRNPKSDMERFEIRMQRVRIASAQEPGDE